MSVLSLVAIVVLAISGDLTGEVMGGIAAVNGTFNISRGMAKINPPKPEEEVTP